MQPSEDDRERAVGRRVASGLCIVAGLTLMSLPILFHDPFSPLRAYSADDYYARGVNYLSRSLPALARKDLELALERDPYRTEAYVALARIDVEQNRADLALPRLRKAIWLDPDDEEALRLRARVYETLGQPERARSDDERARALETARTTGSRPVGAGSREPPRAFESLAEEERP